MGGQWVGRVGRRQPPATADFLLPMCSRPASRLVPTSSRLILRLSRLTFALSGREFGGLRRPAGAVGGQGAGARCDVDRLLTSSHVLASGEDQLVPTSSRLILRLSRLTFALSGVGGRRPRAVARSLAGEDHTTTPRWRARTRTILSRRTAAAHVRSARSLSYAAEPCCAGECRIAYARERGLWGKGACAHRGTSRPTCTAPP